MVTHEESADWLSVHRKSPSDGELGGDEGDGGKEDSSKDEDKGEAKDSNPNARADTLPPSPFATESKGPPMVSFAAESYRVYESQGVAKVTIERSSGEGTVSIGCVEPDTTDRTDAASASASEANVHCLLFHLSFWPSHLLSSSPVARRYLFLAL